MRADVLIEALRSVGVGAERLVTEDVSKTVEICAEPLLRSAIARLDCLIRPGKWNEVWCKLLTTFLSEAGIDAPMTTNRVAVLLQQTFTKEDYPHPRSSMLIYDKSHSPRSG